MNELAVLLSLMHRMHQNTPHGTHTLMPLEKKKRGYTVSCHFCLIAVASDRTLAAKV
jgi:hypothetical protein